MLDRSAVTAAAPAATEVAEFDVPLDGDLDPVVEPLMAGELQARLAELKL